MSRHTKACWILGPIFFENKAGQGPRFSPFIVFSAHTTETKWDATLISPGKKPPQHRHPSSTARGHVIRPHQSMAPKTTQSYAPSSRTTNPQTPSSPRKGRPNPHQLTSPGPNLSQPSRKVSNPPPPTFKPCKTHPGRLSLKSKPAVPKIAPGPAEQNPHPAAPSPSTASSLRRSPPCNTHGRRFPLLFFRHPYYQQRISAAASTRELLKSSSCGTAQQTSVISSVDTRLASTSGVSGPRGA